MNIAINMNTQVSFQVTKDGLDAYVAWAKELGLESRIDFPEVGQKVDMMLWEVMQIFGSHLYNGSTKNIFFENILNFDLPNVAEVF